MTEDIQEFMEALVSLDRLAAMQFLAGRTRNEHPLQCIEKVVVPALEQIGEEWLKGNIALSQVYMAGRICEQLVDRILPPEAPDRKDQPTMAICVLCDHHGLGKSIVYSLLRASGFELVDFGFVEEDELVQRVADAKIAILLISVLMLPSALKVANVRKKLAAKGVDVKIVVGGAPFRFDEQLWKEVGADAMCASASDALGTIEQLIRGEL
jgi:methanogenic corrinoid protein MtbC1